MGCYGIALLAMNAARDGRVPAQEGPFASGALDFDAVQEFEFTTREVECGRCANHCEVIVVRRDGEVIDSWGNRCERGAIKH